MFKQFTVFAMAVLALAAFSQPAAAREFADIYTECGLGAMIAPNNEAVAAVTNVTLDWGTTAISSNISSPDTCKGGYGKTAMFIHDSYETLENEIASGSGDYLDTLMVLAGVEANDSGEFLNNLRKDFSGLVGQDNYGQLNRFEKAEALYNIVYRQHETVS